MTCYHPLIRVEELGKWKRAADSHLYHPARVVSPDTYDLELMRDSKYYATGMVPCGHCIGCRLDYSREWATRGYLESLMWNQTFFVTLTYDDDHIFVPDYVEDKDGYTYTAPDEIEWGGTLIPKDLQDFIKRLRKNILKYYEKNEKDLRKSGMRFEKLDPTDENEPDPLAIRYMACGEYGAETRRPHYHLIIFNLNLLASDLYNPRIINQNYYFQSHMIEKCWKNGISNCCPATWNTMAYVARYITKKVKGAESEEHYKILGQVKEFFRASLKPAIGYNYYEKHWEDIYKNDRVMIRTKDGPTYVTPPKYFDKCLKEDQPELYEKIKRDRKAKAIAKNALKDMTTSLDRLKQLAVEERVKEDAGKKLLREFEKHL